MTPAVIDVTQQTFGKEVLERSHDVPVIVDFWAPWCGPCKTLGPVLERLAEKAEGKWILAKVNTEDSPQLATDYLIRSIPNVKAFVNGEVADEFAGALPEYAVEAWLNKVLPSEADEAYAAARTAESAGDIGGARATYERLLALDSENPSVRAALARLDLRTGDVDSAVEHIGAVPDAYFQTTDGDLERAWVATQAAQVSRTVPELAALIQEDPADVEARFELAMLFAAGEKFDDALTQLLEIVARDRSYRDDIGRLAMIRVFEIVGPQSDSVDAWRSRMGQVMYV